MNKKLLAAAVVAACAAAPAAFADAVVYGKAHVSVDAIDYEATSSVLAPAEKDNYEVNSRASRLGFKGSEDLGNGLKAIYQFEFGIDVDDNAGINNGRNTFVGLAGDWGTFLVGRHDTPQKLAFYAAGNERLGDSIIDLNRSNAGWNISGGAPIGVFHEARVDDAIAYVTPNFSGFTAAVAIVPGEDDGVATGTGTGGADGLADHWSAGLMYSGNGLKASVGYTDYSGDQGKANADDTTVFQVGASYTFNNFSIGAQYEDSDLADVVDYTAWAVTGKFTFGNNALSLVYTDSEFDVGGGSAGDEETTGWGLAAEHNFSKRTKVYAAYATNEVEVSGGDDGDQDVFSLGMIHSF